MATEWESRHGGLSSFNRTFCRFLSAENCDVYCFLPKNPSEKEKDEAQSLGVHLIGPRNSFQSDALGEKYLLCFPPDLPSNVTIDWIIGHGHVTGPAALVQKLNSFPLAHLLHVVHVAPGTTEWFKGDEEGSTAAAKAENRERLEVDIATKADLVVAVGPLLKREISNLLSGETDKIFQLDPGLNFTGSSLRVPPPGEHCLFLGRAEDYRLKGLDIAIRGFALATKNRRPRPVFVVRGAEVNSSNILRRRLSDWSEVDGCDTRVREYSPNAELLLNDLQRSILLLMPSRAEGFGLVALEALGAGVPFLASANSGFAELISSNFGEKYSDFVVPVVDNKEKDASAWGAAIRKTLEAPERMFRRVEALREEYSHSIRWEDGVRNLIRRMEQFQRCVPDIDSESDEMSFHYPTTALRTLSSFKRDDIPVSKRRFDCILKWKTRVGIGAWKNKPITMGSLLIVPTCGGTWNQEDAADGVYILSKRSGEIISHIPTKGDANSIEISGDIFVVGSDSGNVVCAEIDSATIRWEVSLGSPVLSKPRIFNGGVIVATVNGNLWALSLKDGGILNQIPGVGGYFGDPVAFNGRMFYAKNNGYIISFIPEAFISGDKSHRATPVFFRDNFDASGMSRCEFWATPCIIDDVLILPYARGTLYEGIPVIGVDLETMTPMWDSPGVAAEAERLYGNVRANPCVYKDFAIFPITYGNQTVAVSNDGAIQWIAECGHPYFEQYGTPAICGDLVLIPRFDGFIHAVEAESGTPVWSLRFEDATGLPAIVNVSHSETSWENSTADPLNSAIAVDGSYFYVLGSNGQLCCYNVEEDLDI